MVYQTVKITDIKKPCSFQSRVKIYGQLIELLLGRRRQRLRWLGCCGLLRGSCRQLLGIALRSQRLANRGFLKNLLA